MFKPIHDQLKSKSLQHQIIFLWHIGFICLSIHIDKNQTQRLMFMRVCVCLLSHRNQIIRSRYIYIYKDTLITWNRWSNTHFMVHLNEVIHVISSFKLCRFMANVGHLISFSIGVYKFVLNRMISINSFIWLVCFRIEYI